jgi:RNA polymerase sigma factor (sigma-70 family)
LFDFNDISSSIPSDSLKAELMQRICTGEEKAFEMLYKSIYQSLFRFVYRMVHHADLTEDVINETMLVVWEKPECFNYSCKVSTWIFGIAYHKALKTASKQAQTSDFLCVDELSESLSDSRLSANYQMEVDDLLLAALNSLSPEHRAVLELTYYHELPYQEIAEILGCPENTVKTRMFHARKKLQPFLKDLMPDAEDHLYEEKP